MYCVPDVVLLPAGQRLANLERFVVVFL